MVWKKIITLIIVIAVAYFFFFQNAFNGADYELRQLDQRYMSETSVLPNADELVLYQRALETFAQEKTGNATLRELTDIRLKALEIALGAQEVEQDVRTINFMQPDCSANGSLKTSVGKWEALKTKAKNVVNKINQYKRTNNAANLYLENLSQTMNAFVERFSSAQQELNTYC